MTAIQEITISPKNDRSIIVRLSTIPSTGTLTPITSGAITGFLATSPDPDATAAHPSLEASLGYVGGNSDGNGGTYELDAWLWQIDASVLTTALLDPLFLKTKPWLIVVKDNDKRIVIPARYVRDERAVVQS